MGWFNCCLAPHLVDLVERDGVAAALLGQDLRDGSREGGLAVVNMANGADVEVGLPGAEESESALRHSNMAAHLAAVEGGEVANARGGGCKDISSRVRAGWALFSRQHSPGVKRTLERWIALASMTG